MASSLTKHAHILFDEEDYRFLQNLARSRKKPLGELVRTAVQKVYGKREQSLRAAAGRNLAAKKDLQVSDWEEMEEEILRRYG